MDVQFIERCFTKKSGKFHLARWRTPIAPAVVGGPSDFPAALHTALDRLCRISGHTWIDPEKNGVAPNSLFAFVNGWDELPLIPTELTGMLQVTQLVQSLKRQKASQFRKFIYAEDGSLLLSLGMYNTQSRLKTYPSERIAVAQSLLTHLNFQLNVLEKPIVEETPVGWQVDADMAKLVEAAYGQHVPNASHDPKAAAVIYDNL